MQRAIVVPLVAMGLLTGRPDVAAQGTAASWRGVVRDAAGKPLAGAVVELRPPAATEPKGSAGRARRSTTDETGVFGFEQLVPGTYSISLNWQGKTALLQSTVSLRADQHLEAWLEFCPGQKRLALHVVAGTGEATETVIPDKSKQGSSEAQLSSQQVSNLPLNKRDFTQLLQQSVGTTTDTNGASNFTQQFAVNGQRGTNSGIRHGRH
jgi:hypothetical protein